MKLPKLHHGGAVWFARSQDRRAGCSGATIDEGRKDESRIVPCGVAEIQAYNGASTTPKKNFMTSAFAVSQSCNGAIQTLNAGGNCSVRKDWHMGGVWPLDKEVVHITVDCDGNGELLPIQGAHIYARFDEGGTCLQTHT